MKRLATKGCSWTSTPKLATLERSSKDHKKPLKTNQTTKVWTIKRPKTKKKTGFDPFPTSVLLLLLPSNKTRREVNMQLNRQISEIKSSEDRSRREDFRWVGFGFGVWVCALVWFLVWRFGFGLGFWFWFGTKRLAQEMQYEVQTFSCRNRYDNGWTVFFLSASMCQERCVFSCRSLPLGDYHPWLSMLF